MTVKCRKRADSIPTESIRWASSWPELVGDDERHRLFSYLEERFGISENIFDDYLMFKRGSNWWLLKETPPIEFGAQLKVSQVGMKAFQRVGAFVKPATRMIQRFGHNATRARVDLNKEQLLKLLTGEPIPIGLDLDEGYVILSLRESWILGLGLFINGRIHSQLPRKTLRRDMLQPPAPHPRDQHQRNLLGGLSLYFL